MHVKMLKFDKYRRSIERDGTVILSTVTRKDTKCAYMLRLLV